MLWKLYMPYFIQMRQYCIGFSELSVLDHLFDRQYGNCSRQPFKIDFILTTLETSEEAVRTKRTYKVWTAESFMGSNASFQNQKLKKFANCIVAFVNL